MAGAIAQTKANAVDTSATTIASGSFGSDVTSGNKLYVIANAGDDQTITPSKNSGTATIGSFTSLGSVQEAGVLDKLEHFVADITGTGSLDILITYGASTDRRCVLAIEVSGVSGIDVNNEVTSTGDNPDPNPELSVTVTAQPAFAIAFGTLYQGGTPHKESGSPWTEDVAVWTGVANACVQIQAITATGALGVQFANASVDRSNFCMAVFTDGAEAPADLGNKSRISRFGAQPMLRGPF